MANFALMALSLPISNAVVERVFSVMNCVKSKLRNRMGMKMLNSILYARLFPKIRNFCCNKFTPTARMYLLHNSSMYSKSIPEECKSTSSSSTDNDALGDVDIQLFYEALMTECDEGNPSTITLYAADV